MKIIEQKFQVSYSYPVIFTHDVFDTANPSLCRILPKTKIKPNKMLVVIDSTVMNALPKLAEKIDGYARKHSELLKLIGSPVIIKGGESCKEDGKEVEKIQALIEKHHMCRHSFVMAIGGGAVLDAAGFAVATAHRGLRLIRLPTTTLAQNDAGVGVKNGINGFQRKNFLGTFSPPYAVINDFDFLKTLPQRELRAGISEAVKVALIKDKTFFNELYRERKALAAFQPEAMEKMIIRCAELHIEHIGQSGDPFEFGSSRPLDFGHWSAHKIEELTGGEVRHGEAVAMGISLDSLYSHLIGFLSELELRKIFTTLEDIGFELYHWAMSWMDIDKALREFQEHLGGELTIILLKEIGNQTEVHEIDTGLFRKGIDMLARRRKEHKGSSSIERWEKAQGSMTDVEK
jgi:3-dehydroquinate synthase